MKSLPLFAALIGLSIEALAADYSVSWFKIAGGGGTSTNGQFSLSGTIGQHDACGPMSGGNYSLTGGFWALFAVQAPGAPLLSIARTTTNTVIVFWPSPSIGWNLQENTNSVSTSNWVDHPFPADNGTIKYILINPPEGARFFRLVHP